MAPRDILYTPEGDALKSRYIELISGSDVPRVDRAIDIIYQTPDSIIIPYLENALARNPEADPKKLVSAISGAESKIFKDYQAAPWDEVHHGRASLSSMRNIRYLSPEERVFALNKTAEVVGGPIGNSPFNLGGNVAGRGAHTGGSIPWKNPEGIKYREAYDLPTTPKSQSMHPMGTDAAKDPRGLVVPQVDTGADFVQRAKDSIKIQFNDTVTGRYSDLPRRVIVENMLQGAQRKRGDFSTGSGLLYGVDANPQDVKAAKTFLQLPENEQLRINMLKGSFTPDSPQGQKFLANPKNAALADMYISQLYNANLPIPIPTGSQLKQLAPSIKAQLPFAASSAIEPLQRGEPTRALEEVAKGTAIGMATDPIVKPIMSRLIPAVGSVAAAAPVATTAAAAVASELAAPRAAQGGPERVTVNGTPYWLDKKANKVYTNDGRPTSFGVDIRGGKPQLVPRGQGAGTKRAAADPIRQAMQGNLMPALNMLNPMSQLLRFSNSAMKTIRGEV
jgi:hypothetical protein